MSEPTSTVSFAAYPRAIEASWKPIQQNNNKDSSALSSGQSVTVIAREGKIAPSSDFKSPELAKRDNTIKGVLAIAAAVILIAVVVFTVLAATGVLPFAVPGLTPLAMMALKSGAGALVGLFAGAAVVTMLGILAAYKGVKCLHEAQTTNKRAIAAGNEMSRYALNNTSDAIVANTKAYHESRGRTLEDNDLRHLEQNLIADEIKAEADARNVSFCKSIQTKFANVKESVSSFFNNASTSFKDKINSLTGKKEDSSISNV